MATALQLNLRRALMKAIANQLETWGKSQQVMAKKLGVSQPRLNVLLKGNVESFSLDTLIAIAAKAGLNVRLSAVRKYKT